MKATNCRPENEEAAPARTALSVQNETTKRLYCSTKALTIVMDQLPDARFFYLVPDSKIPFKGISWKADATRDPDKVKAIITGCFEGKNNIGLAIGANAFVLDVDCKNSHSGYKTLDDLTARHGNLPCTFTVETPSGGLHYYFKCDSPVRNTTGELGDGLDTKSNGGYVVFPPSKIDGKHYSVIDNSPIAPAPEWLIRLANSKQPRTNKHSAQNTHIKSISTGGEYTGHAYYQKILNNALTEVVTAPIGTRNDTLFRETGKIQSVVNARLLPQSVIDSFYHAAEQSGLEPLQIERTILSATSTADVWADHRRCV